MVNVVGVVLGVDGEDVARGVNARLVCGEEYVANILPVVCGSEALVFFEHDVNVVAGVVSYSIDSGFQRSFAGFAGPVATGSWGSSSGTLRRVSVCTTACRSQHKLPFGW